MNRILIGIPIHHSQPIPERLLKDLTNLKGEFEILFMRDLEEEEFKKDRVYRIALARERLRKYTLGKGFTHLFFIDTDISFPSETLEVLLSYDGDLISHSYPSKIKREEMVTEGLGCTLIKRTVLEKCSFLRDGMDFKLEGEDIQFRRQVKENGFKIINLNGKLKIEHLPYDLNNILLQWSRKNRSGG